MRFKELLLGCILFYPVHTMAYETPTMGWSSWNTYRVNISEEAIKKQAQAMYDKGLGKVGYQYINIDDGYFGGRNDKGTLLVHPTRFPNGLKPVVNFIHNLGFKAGIYSDAGRNTCGSFWDGDKIGMGVGMYGNDQKDADFFFKELDFDFIKVDFCGGDPGQNTEKLDLDERTRYTAIRQAIENTGKQNIRMNVCRWAFPGTWVHDVATSWRIDADINMSWGAVKRIIDKNLYLSAYATEGKFNDMDIMEVGRGLSDEEDKTHFGMWCIMSSPLMIGCDITTISDKALALLTNSELIALNQDTLAIQAEVIEKQGSSYILVKDVEKRFGKVRAIAFYNSGDTEQTINIDLKKVGLGGNVQIRDLYTHSNLTQITNSQFSVDVPAHGTRIYRMEAEERLEQCRYEAENAWLDKYSAIEGGNFARVISDGNSSSGAYVGYLGDIDITDNYMEWRTIYSKNGGAYTLNISYISAENRNLSIQVNNSNKEIIKNLNSGSWSTSATAQTIIQLKPGLNTIRMGNDAGAAPNIDYIEVLPVREESELVTFYSPTERAHHLLAGKPYMLYNTAMWNGQDRTNFVFSNGTGLSTNKIQPGDLFTDNDAYLFSLEECAISTDPGLYFLKSKHGYVDTKGVTNYSQPQNVYLNYWTENMDETLGATECRLSDGSVGEPKDAVVWAITKRNGPALNERETDYAWNGNINSWASWSNAHPYAFYEVVTKEFKRNVIDQMQAIDKAKNNLLMSMSILKERYGMVKTSEQYYCNEPQRNSSLSALLDSDPNTFFHSNYSATSEGVHYLQADLDKSITSAYFYFRKRTDNNNNRPIDMTVSVRLEGEDSFTEVAHLTQGFPTAENCPDYLSAEITAEGKNFNALRFTINKTNNEAKDPSGHQFFTFSEFYVLEGNSVTIPYFNALNVSLRKNSEQEINEAYWAIENSFVEKDFAAQELSDYLKSLQGLTGSALGKYQETASYLETVNAAALLLEDLTLCTVSDIRNARFNLEKEFSALMLNLPEIGKYYRFKSATKNTYLVCGENDEVLKLTEDSDNQNTVFFLTSDNRLVGNNHLSLSGNKTSSLWGDVYSFRASNAVAGAYAVMHDSMGKMKGWCAGGNQLDTSVGAPANQPDCAWILEEVTDMQMTPQFTLTIPEMGFSTLISPVSLVIPNGVQAYTGTIEGNYLVLHQIQDFIPAGEAVVIEGTGTHSFIYHSESNASIGQNDIEGVYVETHVTDGNRYYTLQSENGRLGFYKYMGETLDAFKGYIVQTDLLTDIEGFLIKNNTTGIDLLQDKPTVSRKIFDITGKQVLETRYPGMYLINGKKVLILK